MSSIKPIYTMYESMRLPDGTWGLGHPLGVTHWTSKRKVEKAIRAHYESMVAQKEGTDFEFHKKEGFNEPYFEFTRYGTRYHRWIVQHLLV